jgi:4-oxalocrotonate tautomerase
MVLISHPDLGYRPQTGHRIEVDIEARFDRTQIDIQLIEGVFDKAQKQEMIRKVTDAMVASEGEAMRGLTWVRVHEVASGEWGIGGKGVTTADVNAVQA